MRKLAKYCLVLILLCGILAAPTVYRGYHLYKNAVGTVSVENKAAEIRSKLNFIPLSDKD